MRRALIIGAAIWVVVGAAVALIPLPSVNADARLVIGVMGVVFPACAAAAGLALHKHRDRLAGGLLLLSVLTPTYYLYVLPIPALIFGVALLIAPAKLIKELERSH